MYDTLRIMWMLYRLRNIASSWMFMGWWQENLKFCSRTKYSRLYGKISPLISLISFCRLIPCSPLIFIEMRWNCLSVFRNVPVVRGPTLMPLFVLGRFKLRSSIMFENWVANRRKLWAVPMWVDSKSHKNREGHQETPLNCARGENNASEDVKERKGRRKGQWRISSRLIVCGL